MGSIHRKSISKNIEDRQEAVELLKTHFPNIPDKDKAQAWKDLHNLTQDQDSDVRRGAAEALGSAFGHVPDKDKAQAWKDLINLTRDKDGDVREGAAGALARAFSQLPDKKKDLTLQDLIRLTQDPYKDVRMYSYHSLGRVSIYKATTSVEDEVFRENLREAIDYFEKSAQEATYYNPARFCIPFYRSFLAVTSQAEGAQEQVDLYLAAAKDAIGRSKSRKLLFVAVENLSRALREAQNASELYEAQAVLEACLPYCNQAEELINKTEEMAPGASGVIRRGLPIINQQIKMILKEIDENSSRLLEATKQTPFEPITTRTVERIKDLSGVRYGLEAESIMNDVVSDIRVMCNFLRERGKESVCELKNWESLGFEGKVSLFKRAITHCANQMENLTKQIGDKDDQIIYLRDGILTRLDNINFHVFKISIRSADVIQGLKALEYELQKIKKIKDDLDRLGQSVDDLGIRQQQALRELQESAPKLIRELEEITNKDDLRDASKQEIPRGSKQEILNRLQALKDSPAGAVLDLAASLSSIISLILTIHPLH
jgi:hypothetical protein